MGNITVNDTKKKGWCKEVTKEQDTMIMDFRKAIERRKAEGALAIKPPTRWQRLRKWLRAGYARLLTSQRRKERKPQITGTVRYTLHPNCRCMPSQRIIDSFIDGPYRAILPGKEDYAYRRQDDYWGHEDGTFVAGPIDLPLTGHVTSIACGPE